MKWKTTEYNYGDHFDGSFFTVPEDGIYTFYLTARQASTTGQASTAGYAHIYVNEIQIAYSLHSESSVYTSNVSVSVTIKLQRDDKVKAAFSGNLFYLNEAKTTYFEGRLISKIESAQTRIPVYGRYG